MRKTKDNKTKEKILTVAKELFYAQGYNKTTIRQIQKISNNRSIHYYYKQKKDIAIEIFSNYIASVDTLFFSNYTLQSSDSFLQMLTRIIFILRCIVKNENEKMYYIESLRECKFDYNSLLMERNLDKMIDISKTYADREISHDLVKCYYLISLSCQEELFPGVFNGLLNISIEDMIKIQVKIGPLLYGINERIIDDKFDHAMALVENIESNIRLLS